MKYSYNILSKFNPTTPYKPRNAKKVMQQLVTVYGEYLLARILKCKIGMIRRALKGSPLFSDTQVSKINFLIMLEEQVAKTSQNSVPSMQNSKTRNPKKGDVLYGNKNK